MRDIAEVTRQIANGVRSLDRKTKLSVVYRSTVRPGTIEGLIIPIFRSVLAGALDVIEVAYNSEFLREATAVHDFFHPPKIVVGTHEDRSARALRR